MKSIAQKIFFISMIILMFAHATDAAKSFEVEFITDDHNIDQKHILIVTSRFYEADDAEEVYFKNEPNNEGLIFIKAWFDEGKWSLNLKSSFNELTETSNGYDDYMVYVHGDSKTFYTAAEQGLQMQEEYSTNVIVYSWPSKDPKKGGIKNFKNSRSHVEEGADDFMQLMHLLKKWKYDDESFHTEDQLTLFMHSLGNYHMQQFIETNNYQDFNDIVFDNILLNAAAVNRDGHVEWLEKLNIQNQLIITYNKKDFNLSGVWFFSDWGKQLGEEPGEERAANASYINFTEAVGFPKPFYLSHGYYMGEMPERNENIFNFYNNVFHGEDIDPTLANYNLNQKVASR